MTRRAQEGFGRPPLDLAGVDLGPARRLRSVATGREHADVAPTPGTGLGPAHGRLSAGRKVGLAAA